VAIMEKMPGCVRLPLLSLLLFLSQNYLASEALLTLTRLVLMISIAPPQWSDRMPARVPWPPVLCCSVSLVQWPPALPFALVSWT
jgi:hypothetical protein